MSAEDTDEEEMTDTVELVSHRCESDFPAHVGDRGICQTFVNQGIKNVGAKKIIKNLIRWGGVLLELAHLHQGQESINMLQDAVSKFEEALKINRRKHDAQWCLGNAFTSQGFLFSDTKKAKEYFKRAAVCFQKAIDEDPLNEHYLKALEMAEKAPSLHQEIQKQLASQQVVMGRASNSEESSTKVIRKKKSNEFKYDILGWVALSIGIIAWVGMAKSPLPLSLTSPSPVYT